MRRFKRTLAMVLVLCMVAAFLPVTVGAVTQGVTGSVIEFSNYFAAEADAQGTSTNDHYTMMGIGVDADGMAYAIVASDKEYKFLKDLEWLAINPGEVSFEEIPEEDRLYLDGNNEEVFYNGATLTIRLSDGTIVTVNGDGATHNAVGYFVIPLGDFDALMSDGVTFNLAIFTSEGGWQIQTPGVAVTVNLSYEITKTVDKSDAELGDTLNYTVTVRNTGDHRIPNVNVYDALPPYLDENSVSVTVLDQDHSWSWGTNPYGDRALVLDTGITLGVAESKTYLISANVLSDFKGGTLTNKATIGSDSLAELDATATTEVRAYFYVHHIFNNGQGTKDSDKNVTPNADEVRVDKVAFTEQLRNGDKFNVTEANSAGTVYGGMHRGTLYGGTFCDGTIKDSDGNVISSNEGEIAGFYNDVYPFADGENGVYFTPEINEHYYVWEPIDTYLRPNNLAVWHKPDNEQYHTVTGYPVSAVDRRYYQQFGFIKEVDSDVNLSEGTYKQITAAQQIEPIKVYSIEADHTQAPNLPTGYVGCYEFPAAIFGNNIHETPYDGGEHQTFLPYWVTMDGVKVTGDFARTASYKGVGDTFDYTYFHVEDKSGNATARTYAPRSNQTLMISAMFFDNDLEHPAVPEQPAPETVGVEFDPVCAGKSGNVKALNLTAELTGFHYDDSWFMVNGERLDAEDQGDEIFAELDMKHFKNGDQITIVPCWLDGDEEFSGGELVLEVVKKTVEIIPETSEEDFSELPEEEAFVEESEYAEDESFDEAEDEFSEDGSEEEYVEESDKKAAKEAEKEAKKAEKEAKKAEKKAKKESNQDAAEESVEVMVEEITTVAFIRSTVASVQAPMEHEMGTIGVILQ